MPEAIITLNENDFVDAVRIHGRRSLKGRRYALIVSIVVAATIGYALPLLIEKPMSAAILLGILVPCFWIAMLLCVRFLLPIVARRAFRRQNWGRSPMYMAWSSEVLKIKTDQVDSTVVWSRFSKWDEADGWFLLYTTPRTYLVMPQRVFRDENEIADVRRFLHDAGVPKASFRNS